MKKLILKTFIIILTVFLGVSYSFALPNEEKKKEIIALYNANKLEDAYNLISKLSENERDAELWFLLGNMTQDFNNDDNAVFFYKKAVSINKEFDKAHYNIANIYLKQKKYNNAINEYQLAIKYKKDYPYYYYNLGCAYMGLKEYQEARNSFKKAIMIKADEPSFYYNLALSEKLLGKNKDAQKTIDIYNKFNTNEDS